VPLESPLETRLDNPAGARKNHRGAIVPVPHELATVDRAGIRRMTLLPRNASDRLLDVMLRSQNKRLAKTKR
jgi:hypothetical protein